MTSVTSLPASGLKSPTHDEVGHECLLSLYALTPCGARRAAAETKALWSASRREASGPERLGFLASCVSGIVNMDEHRSESVCVRVHVCITLGGTHDTGPTSR